MKKLFLFFSLTSFLIIVSCKKENSSPGSLAPDATTTTDLSGFGDRGGLPSGNMFYLPSYIKQTTPMKVWDSTFVNYEVHGIGNIGGCFTLLNIRKISCYLTLPDGLIFLRDNDSSQSGLSIYPVTLKFDPNESKRIYLKFFCMNRHKGVNFYAGIYTMNVVSNNDQVVKLINSLKFKDEVVLYNHTFSNTQRGLEDIVWDISDSTGLSQADLDSIKSW